jgi:GNAT superfamily N-acetyltransferase
LEIREVVGPRAIEQFVKVPWRIYAGDPQWVPQLISSVKEFIDRRRHPFYGHGDATQFLALRDGVSCGRIQVSDDPNYNRQHQSNVGHFGMFECDDDPETAHALLDAAARWLRQRRRTTIVGPVDYSTNYTCGLLVEGFDTPPCGMMNHHRPYYAGLLQSWGLRKIKDLYAWWFTDPYDLAAKWNQRAQRIAHRTGLVVRSLRKNDLDAEIRRCQSVCDATMHKLWGFVAPTESEIRHMAREYGKYAVLEHFLLAEADGRLIGFAITLPNLNEAIGPLNGRLTRFGLPINAIRLAWRLRRVKTAQMIELAVAEDHRCRGIAELLILKSLDYGKNVLGYTGAELSWTLEDNSQINQTIEAVGARRYKTYRIYSKEGI